MKSKTLLIAVAALAAGVISSQAQVYSQNIVGYANVVNSVGGQNYFMAVPFKVGSSNGINEVFAGGLPSPSYLNVWNGSGFDVYVYDNTDPASLGTDVVWYQSDDFTALSTFPKLPVGAGFVLNPAGAWTNTFAGAIPVNVGTSNNMTLAAGGQNYFIGCAVPYGGSVTNGNSSTGGPNLNNLPSPSYVNFWNGAGFTVYVYDNTDPASLGTDVVWYQSDDFTPTAPPNITVGQAFVLNPAGPYTWTTGL